LIRGNHRFRKTELYPAHRQVTHGKKPFPAPEIALTPPLGTVAERMEPISRLWHSGLPEAARYQTGPLSAGVRRSFWARDPRLSRRPFHLGLIVLDEELEPSYKRKIVRAITRAMSASSGPELSSASLVMGAGATRACGIVLERPKQGIYHLLEMTSRVEQRSLPAVD